MPYTIADLSVSSATFGGVIGVLLFVILTLVMTIAILGVYIKTRGKENTFDIGTPWGIKLYFLKMYDYTRVWSLLCVNYMALILQELILQQKLSNTCTEYPLPHRHSGH